MSDLRDFDIEIGPEDEVSREVIPHTEITNERSLSRRAALQALYEIDSAQHPVGIVLQNVLNAQDPTLSTSAVEYTHGLVVGVHEHAATLDEIIRQYASEFPLSQVAIVDRNILRIAIYEFALKRLTPVGVAIDEAVELAKLFGAEGAARFVNGVLGSLADDSATLTQIALEQDEHE
ncbi:MAG: transcription antitermination factor NusB [Anaerolineae bacterium]|nr:transcription antitermination factor NusB [Anaerolineae bacterium]